MAKKLVAAVVDKGLMTAEAARIWIFHHTPNKQVKKNTANMGGMQMFASLYKGRLGRVATDLVRLHH